MAAWAIGLLVAAGIVAGALIAAIRINGPAVLDTVDRLAGGARDTALVEQVRLGPSATQKLRVYAPRENAAGAGSQRSPLPVLLFVHGGGWHSGDPDHYGFVARSFVPEGYVVVLAGYRLHPEARFPAMLEDTAAAIAWTRDNIARHGGDPDRIVLAGHSAGAYNVAMAALDRKWLADRGVEPASIAGVVGLAGPYDFYPFDSQSTINSFGHIENGERTQPLGFVNASAPPMLLVHGSRDTVVRPRNSRVLGEMLERAGARAKVAILPGLDHTDVIVALAKPWQDRRDVRRLMLDFMADLSPSVPVQAETR